MAYRLIFAEYTLEGDSLLDSAPLNCFDTLGDDSFSHDRSGMLAERSAFEMVRDQLDDAQRAELDMIDDFWRTNADAFNRDFRLQQAFLDRTTILSGMVVDAKGKVPEIPRSHWWWWPIKEEGEE